MTDILEPAEAWRIFYKAFHKSPEWKALPESEKSDLRKTNRAVIAGAAGSVRIEHAFDRYAAGRFEYVGGFRLVE